jgi:hypothetical protein
VHVCGRWIGWNSEGERGWGPGSGCKSQAKGVMQQRIRVCNAHGVAASHKHVWGVLVGRMSSSFRFRVVLLWTKMWWQRRAVQVGFKTGQQQVA